MADPTYTPAGANKPEPGRNYQAVETPTQTPQMPCFTESPGHTDTGVQHTGDMGRLGKM